nr:hypothetical protein CFP56_34267 [Quercus suber]
MIFATKCYRLLCQGRPLPWQTFRSHEARSRTPFWLTFSNPLHPLPPLRGNNKILQIGGEFWAFIEGTEPNIVSDLRLCERRENYFSRNNLIGEQSMKMKSNPSGRSDSLHQAVLVNDVLLFVVLEFALICKI